MSSLKNGKHSVVVIEPTQYKNEKFNTFSTTQSPDLPVTFKDTTVCLHKSLLMDRCKFFNVMLGSDYKESETNKVNIEFDMEVSIFNLILEYIQTGKIVLSTENLEPVYRAAIYFMLDDLSQFCFDLIKQKIDCETVDYIHTLGKDELVAELSKAAMSYKEKHFEAICKNRAFLEWNMESIKELLCSDHIKVKNEKKVLLFVFEWLQFDLDKRLDKATELIMKIRHFYLTDDHVDEVLENDKSAASQLSQIVSKLFNEFSFEYTEPRKYHVHAAM